jgi:uncharacterized protein HemX
MKISLLASVLAIATLAAGGSAFAQAPLATPKVEQRQVNQEKRIDQGIASGALTQKEAVRLDKRETKIEADKLAAKSDGKVTQAERRHLNREQNRASAAIKRQKHDAQVAPRKAG